MDHPIAQGFEVYGKFKAYLGVFMGIVICMIFSAIGYFIINRKATFANETSGDAKNVKCTSNVCETDVTVSLYGNTYTPHLMYGPGLVDGSKVKVYYTDDKPPRFDSKSDNIPKAVGYGMISSALCVCLVSIVVAVVVSQSKAAAQVYGGIEAIQNVSGFIPRGPAVAFPNFGLRIE